MFEYINLTLDEDELVIIKYRSLLLIFLLLISSFFIQSSSIYIMYSVYMNQLWIVEFAKVFGEYFY